MKLRTKDVIKILPLDEGFKKDLLSSYDSLNPDVRNDIVRILWDAYDCIFQMRLEKNLNIALNEAMENREKLDPGLYKRVRDLTRSEMAYMNEEDLKSTDLTQAREELAKLIPPKN